MPPFELDDPARALNGHRRPVTEASSAGGMGCVSVWDAYVAAYGTVTKNVIKSSFYGFKMFSKYILECQKIRTKNVVYVLMFYVFTKCVRLDILCVHKIVT